MLLPFWSVALAIGMALGFLPGAAVMVWPALVLAAGGAGLVFARRVVLGGAALALGLGALLATQTAGPPKVSPVLERASRGDREVVVVARWVRTLFDRGRGAPGERALLALESVDGSSENARLIVTFEPGRAPFLPGDRIRFRGRLAEPPDLANPGVPAPRARARGPEIELLARPARNGVVELVRQGHSLNPRRLAQRAHAAMARAIDGAVPGGAAGLLRALVLGERFAVAAEAEDGFKAAGALHVLSVSGLHLTALAAFLFLLARRLMLFFPALALRVRPDLLAASLCLPVIAFYVLVSGEAVATVRAALMGGLGFGAILLRRPPSPSAAIACAATVLLLSSPPLLLDLSFQLSFVGVITLAVLSCSWRPSRPGAHPVRRAAGWLGRALLTSAAAFLATAPLCAHHFGELALAAPIGNLLMVPPLELGALPLGLLGAALGAFHPWLGLLPLRVAGWLSELALWLARGFDRHAPMVPVMSPSALETIVLVVGVLVLLAAAGPSGRFRRRFLAGATAALVLASGSFGVRLLARRTGADLRVTFLDVGQGDAALVEGPGGFVMLIDGGGALQGSFDPGMRVLDPVLRHKAITRIDLMVLSHPHPDHMNGLFRVLQRFEVASVWTPGVAGRSPEHDRFLALARARGVQVADPSGFRRDGLEVQPRGPMLGESVRAPPGLSVNDASLVVRVGFAGRWFLFSGDIEGQGEAELVARAPEGPIWSDVIKVPHHGSQTSSGDLLLDAVAPGTAIFSLGKGNRFGFPRAEVLARYASRGIKLLRTDRDGAITIVVGDSGNLQVTCARPCR